MEHQLGGYLSQSLCAELRDCRVDPWELMGRVRQPLKGTETYLLGIIGAIEVSSCFLS